MRAAGANTARVRAAGSRRRTTCGRILPVAGAVLWMTIATNASAAQFDEGFATGPGVGSDQASVLMSQTRAPEPTLEQEMPFSEGTMLRQNADGSWAIVDGEQPPCERCGAAHAGDCPDLGFSPAAGILNRCLGDACPRWVVQADALMLWRGLVPSRPLFVADPNPPDPLEVYLDINEIYAPVTVGPRVALMLNIDRCCAVEANYFYLDGFNGLANLPDNGTVYNAQDIAGYNFGSITEAQALTDGAIQSFELNLRRWNGGSITWLAGFRWVEWNEGLSMTMPWSDPDAGTTGTDFVNVRNQNDLYGGQVGLDAILLTLWNRVRINGVAKGGLYGNWDARSTVTVGGDTVGPTQTESLKNTPLAYVGEVGVNGTVSLTRNWFLRAGYNFFWLGGLATAGPQLSAVDFTGTKASTINTNGSVFLSGLNLGTEFIW